MISRGIKSTTIKSYISAIKSVLAEDQYEWSENNSQLSSLTRACRLTNDRVKTRLPITKGLLHILLKKMETHFLKKGQYYLSKLYQCLFLLGYYGLLRIGEMAYGPHSVKAKNVHAAKNKRKILIVLFSSKTHGVYTNPQEIRIWADRKRSDGEFCPFKITNQFGELRGGYHNEQENFFVFQDKTPVKPTHVRRVLRKAIKSTGLNPFLYDTHSLRIGRTSDLLRLKYSIDTIKKLGCWKSNAVFRYLKNC